ncbi:hypothetical protein M885DRAFT_471428, partial [Pelagophyceae sp. CCMP2097]
MQEGSLRAARLPGVGSAGAAAAKKPRRRPGKRRRHSATAGWIFLPDISALPPPAPLRRDVIAADILGAAAGIEAAVRRVDGILGKRGGSLPFLDAGRCADELRHARDRLARAEGVGAARRRRQSADEGLRSPDCGTAAAPRAVLRPASSGRVRFTADVVRRADSQASGRFDAEASVRRLGSPALGRFDSGRFDIEASAAVGGSFDRSRLCESRDGKRPVLDGRSAHFGQVRLAARQREVDGGADGVSGAREPSALTYARAVLAQRDVSGLLPVPALLHRRRSAPEVLDLTGSGVGDGAVVALCAALPDLDGPPLDTLLLRDCRLNDASLGVLFDTLAASPTGCGVTALDVSLNDVDASAAALRAYVAAPLCRLRRLELEASDVDDSECELLSAAVEANSSLTRLSLRDNLIGSNEQQNAVTPDLVTGAEALAAMLAKNGFLTDLDVSWNKIRGASAVCFARQLGLSKSLVTLNLSMNSFGDEAAMHLGVSLMADLPLRSVDLSYNTVGQRGAFVIAGALPRNSSLTFLDLGGNALGRRGGAAVVGAVRRAQRADRALDVSLENADCDRADESIFDPNKPGGEYDLDLESPYDRTVALDLLRIASNKRGCELEAVSHAPPGKAAAVVKFARVARTAAGADASRAAASVQEAWASAALRFGRAAPAERQGALGELFASLGLSPSAAVLADVLGRHVPAASEVPQVAMDVFEDVFFALFDVFDVDATRCIDVRELQRVCEALGWCGAVGSAEAACRALALFDVDASHELERDEFCAWCMAAFLQRPRPPPVGDLVDASTRLAWRLPNCGRLRLVFAADAQSPGDEARCCALGQAALMRHLGRASTDAERLKLFSTAVAASTDVYFTALQAQEVLDRGRVGLERPQLIAALLPAMCSRAEAHILLARNLPLLAAVRLREKMGPAHFDACCGNATGHYALDVGAAPDDASWRSLRKIAMCAADQAAFSRASKRGDTSQRGNWLNFRNETVDGAAAALTPDFFARAGAERPAKVAFDFVSTARPRATDKAISHRRFQHVAALLSLDAMKGFDDDFRAMPEDQRRRSAIFVPSIDAAEALRRSNAAQSRADAADTARPARPPTPAAVAAPAEASEAPPPPCAVPAWARVNCISQWKALRRSTHYRTRWPGDEKAAAKDGAEAPLKDSQVEPTESYRVTYYNTILLRGATAGLWLRAAQVVRLVSQFPAADYCRVAVACLLHARTLDVEHFVFVFDLLEENERDELAHRLGWLNAANATEPDLALPYLLDLRWRDHREL